MNKLIGSLAAGVLMLGLQYQALAATAQQNKMKECNAEAKTKELKSDERKAFMKDCLSTKKEETAAAKTAQQEKMTACNAEAKSKELKADERKAFMKDCLSAEKKK